MAFIIQTNVSFVVLQLMCTTTCILEMKTTQVTLLIDDKEEIFFGLLLS